MIISQIEKILDVDVDWVWNEKLNRHCLSSTWLLLKPKTSDSKELLSKTRVRFYPDGFVSIYTTGINYFGSSNMSMTKHLFEEKNFTADNIIWRRSRHGKRLIIEDKIGGLKAEILVFRSGALASRGLVRWVGTWDSKERDFKWYWKKDSHK